VREGWGKGMKRMETEQTDETNHTRNANCCPKEEGKASCGSPVRRTCLLF